MGINRKFKRKIQNKQKKQIKKSMKKMVQRMNSLGDHCANCGREFDRENPDNLQDWVVYVMDDVPNLICPVCKEEIEALKKEYLESNESEIDV